MTIENSGEETKKDILNRLNKIEGQVKGIQRMIESEKQCGDVLTQISAVRAATNKVGVLLLERYSKNCILNSINSKENNNEEVLDEFLTTVKRFLKFVE
jgi:DNA-binding FrmR family transcriptional regulator